MGLNGWKNKLKQNKMNDKKSGMYGEMPEIKIGKYIISNMDNEEDCQNVWIKNTETEEGGQFCKRALEKIVDKFYKEFF